jgi:hypothetical protein
MEEPFEPMEMASLNNITLNTVFLVAADWSIIVQCHLLVKHGF